MEFLLKASEREKFESSMEQVGRWFHSYKFGEDTYTGFYKHEGLTWDETWSNARSHPELINRLRTAYERRNLQPWRDLVAQAVLETGLKAEISTALDISSAAGRNSFILADLGFRKVISSEIRKDSHKQHKLILNAITDQKYSDATETIHDPVSADVPEFVDTYTSKGIDLACSFHLLYHLTNPAQHFLNLYEITRRFALIFTKTHHQYALPWAGKNGWIPTIEPYADPANAANGFGWTPNFWEVPRLAHQTGFDVRWTGYLAPFEINFAYFRRSSNYVLGRRFIEHVLSKLAHRPIGYRRNLNPEYHGPFHVDPHYFMFVLEKSDRKPEPG